MEYLQGHSQKGIAKQRKEQRKEVRARATTFVNLAQFIGQSEHQL